MGSLQWTGPALSVVVNCKPVGEVPAIERWSVMQPKAAVIEPLNDPVLLAALAADAQSDGRRMVSRFIEEWVDGRNRYQQTGERAYVAVIDGRIVAVCGLNVDPFAANELIGRIRRMYVAVKERRKGIGSAIIDHIVAGSRNHFRMLHLRTHDPEAAAFYEANGFARVDGDPNCTHRRPAVAEPPAAVDGPGGMFTVI